MRNRSQRFACRQELPGFAGPRHHFPQPMVDLVADQLSQQMLTVGPEIMHPSPAAILCQHSQLLRVQRLRHIGPAKEACAASLFFSSPAVRSKYALVTRSYAGAQHAMVPPAVRNRDGIHRRANLVLYKLPGICQFLFQFAVRTMRQHGMGQRMRLDLVSARVEFTQVRPLHIFISAADPSCGDEKDCAQLILLQQWQSIRVLGDMAVVEGHIWYTRTSIGGAPEFGRYLQMLLKLLRAAVIRIRLSSRSQFVINQEQRFQIRDACFFAWGRCRKHKKQ